MLAPSRFGYLGSSLPRDGSPVAQADVYAALLDALRIERTAVFGYSAGGPSAIQFALRHPERTDALVLLASALPGRAGSPPKVLARLLFGSNLFFWSLTTYAPTTMARLIGVPKSLRPSAAQEARIREAARSFLPVYPRKAGVLFDLYVSNPAVQRFPLEEIRVPTVIISAKDDPMSAHENAEQAARRIPNVKLVAIENGGHLLLDNEQGVREELRSIVTSSSSGMQLHH